jgi:hypothetical protein
MKDKNCTHKSFWQIYKIINFNKTFCWENGREYRCELCNKKCVLKWKWYNKMKKNFVIRFITYLLWLSPAIILILLVAYWMLNFLVAILIITMFHFWAMYFIINSSRLKIKNNID